MKMQEDMPVKKWKDREADFRKTIFRLENEVAKLRREKEKIENERIELALENAKLKSGNAPYAVECLDLKRQLREIKTKYAWIMKD